MGERPEGAMGDPKGPMGSHPKGTRNDWGDQREIPPIDDADIERDTLAAIG